MFNCFSFFMMTDIWKKYYHPLLNINCTVQSARSVNSTLLNYLFQTIEKLLSNIEFWSVVHSNRILLEQTEVNSEVMLSTLSVSKSTIRNSTDFDDFIFSISTDKSDRTFCWLLRGFSFNLLLKINNKIFSCFYRFFRNIFRDQLHCRIGYRRSENFALTIFEKIKNCEIRKTLIFFSIILFMLIEIL